MTRTARIERARHPGLWLTALTCLALAASACNASHGRDDAGSRTDGGTSADGGTRTDGGCAGWGSAMRCTSCGGDVFFAEVCVDGRWTCPTGTRPYEECPPTCWGYPGEGCVCDDGEWVCPDP